MCTKDPYMISFQIIDKVEQQVLYHANFRLDDPIKHITGLGACRVNCLDVLYLFVISNEKKTQKIASLLKLKLRVRII